MGAFLDSGAAEQAAAENRFCIGRTNSTPGRWRRSGAPGKGSSSRPGLFPGTAGTGGLGAGFLYALVAMICYSVESAGAAVTEAPEPEFLADVAEAAGLARVKEPAGINMSGSSSTVGRTLGFLLALPLMLFYALLLLAGTYHFTALLLGGRGTFEASFKITAYLSSVLVFVPLPVIGRW